MGELDRLHAIERDLEREWWWLSGALHAVAQVSSGDPHAYCEMMAQKRAVDRKRAEVACRIAELVGPPSTDLNLMHGDLSEVSAPQRGELQRRT
jgi:hypothetical protein